MNGDLLALKDIIHKEYWNDQQSFTREQMRAMLDLIERMDDKISELQEELIKIENTTLGGVLNRINREGKM